jgi:hypothetical protein
MSRSDAEYWLASYNAWAELWNRHERDRSLPLSPDWAEAENIGVIGCSLPRSALVFRVRATQRMGAIRVRGWSPFFPSWSFCRNAADPACIVWAGWVR